MGKKATVYSLGRSMHHFSSYSIGQKIIIGPHIAARESGVCSSNSGHPCIQQSIRGSISIEEEEN